VWNCLLNWKNKFLSQVGKEVLIKAIVQAIPTYCMSVFLLPRTLCKEIHGMMQRFWWGHKDNHQKKKKKNFLDEQGTDGVVKR
jgi:hypothetical protein